jgi:hypothetical protein
VQHVIRKGFVWCLLHGDDIDGIVAHAESAIVDAFQKYNVRLIATMVCYRAANVLVLVDDQHESFSTYH